MGLVNTVVPLDELEAETVQWCREMLELSPFSLRLLKASFHAAEDGLSGIQQLAHDANLLFYASDEAKEGREAYKEKRKPDFTQFPTTTLSPLHIWLMAARPRTLPAAVAPVLVGTALAATEGTFRVLTFVAAMLGALFIQVGTNLSNDYSDARRGADTEDRLGPVRVTAGGLVPPRQVLVATYVAFGLAVLAGAYLIATAGWELLLIGVASILAGVLYTGGPRPYGYEGLGEVFVFLFFGVVAVTGSYFAQVERLEWEAFVLAVPVGLLASAILVVNNVRDLETDRRAGKRTLAVRLGRARARMLYAVMVYGAFVCAPLPWLLGSDELSAWLLLPLIALPLAVPVVRIVRSRSDGPSLERRPGAHRACSSSRSAPSSPRESWRADGRAHGRLRPFQAPRRRCAPPGASWPSARSCACGSTSATATSGWARRRRSSPTTASRSASVIAALDAYEAVLARASPRSTHAELLAACAAERALPQALAAIDLALWDRAGRRTGFPVAQLIAAGAVRSIAVNATIGLPDRAGAAEAAARCAEAGFRCLKLKVGIGDDAGRRGRRARRGRRQDGDPGRRQRGVAEPGRGGRAPAHAGAGRDRAVRGAGPRPRGDAGHARAVARAGGDGRDGRGARRSRLRRRRRRLPEDLPLRRHLGAAARRPRGARGRDEGLRRVGAGRPVWASPPACTPRPGCAPPGRWPTAGWPRWRRSRTWICWRRGTARSRCRPGPGCSARDRGRRAVAAAAGSGGGGGARAGRAGQRGCRSTSVLRVYRPAPTVAFGRLDRLRPGFGAAVAAARRHGFEPVLRAPGGHAVAYHEGCLGFDELLGEPDPIAGMHVAVRRVRAIGWLDASAGFGRGRSRGSGAARVLPGRVHGQRSRGGEAGGDGAAGAAACVAAGRFGGG